MIAEWNVIFETVAGVPAHVCAFGFDPSAGVYVVVDPCRTSIEVDVLSRSRFDRWIAQVSVEAEVWRIAARRETPVWFPGLWCVGVVKRLVGIRSGALSPGGLRRDLQRAGAQRVFVRESQNAPADA